MASPAADQVSFKTHHPAFTELLGPTPTIRLLAKDAQDKAMFHEACVYDPVSKSVYVTSNQIPLPVGQVDAATSNKTVKISRVFDDSSSPNPTPSTIHIEDATPSDLIMANGGVNYLSGLLICAQGNKALTGLSGIVHIPSIAAPLSSPAVLLISSFHGRPFNSVNDVIVHPHDGAIWFTDPCYGWHQGIRPAPVLPNQVYRFDAATGDVRAVADGFVRPNGLCFAPDLATLYVTDTGAITGDAGVPFDKTAPSHIYAFDVVGGSGSGRNRKPGPFLANRRLFAFAEAGCPDGIKCDMEGNVYSGTGDGVDVWNASGVLLGRILVRGGVANFCFGERGALYMCNESMLWKAQIGEHVRGALLGL